MIGAGASGLVAAIYASKKHDVTILERNNVVGKKLLITGNGKCNYFNTDLNINHYNTNKIEELLDDSDKLLEFMTSIGIISKINKGYYYPFSGTSKSIKDALLLECKLNNVKIKYNFLVKNIVKKDKFIVNSNDDNLEFDKIIIAAGSKAYPKTGSDGIGYELLKSLGHKITDIRPGLTYLKGDYNFQNEWHGIRSNVIVKLYQNDNLIKEEEGEIQLTKNGVSGICVFNLSRLVTENNHLKINFMPWCDSIKEALDFLDNRLNQVTGRKVDEFLEGFISEKLIKIILKIAKIEPEKYYDELSNKEKYRLINTLVEFPFKIVGTGLFESSQICLGGVSLDEINIKTMESKIQKDLFIVGELIDVDGDCGGYNLTFAFLSGMRAGMNI